MRAIRRTALAAGLAAVGVAALGLFYTYGAWPVPPGYEFPRHSLWGGPTALYEGTLVERAGCILTESGSTVVWPPGYWVSIDAGRPVVHGIGLEIRMGGPIRLGGGEYDREQLASVASNAAQTPCPEPFFLTTGLVR